MLDSGVFTWIRNPETTYQTWLLAFYRMQTGIHLPRFAKEVAARVIDMVKVCAEQRGVDPKRADLLASCVSSREMIDRFPDHPFSAALIVTSGYLHSSMYVDVINAELQLGDFSNARVYYRGSKTIFNYVSVKALQM